MKKSRHTLMLTLIILAAVFLIFVTGSFLFSHLAKKKIAETQIPGYEFTTQSVETNLIKRQVVVHEIQLSAQNSETSVSIQKTTLKGIKLLRLIFRKNITARHLYISNPKIILSNQEKKKQDSDRFS